MFPESSSKNSNLHDSGSSLPAFQSRTNLKLQNIPLTAEMIKKAAAFDFRKVSGPNYIPVVALTNCEPELLNILANFFNSASWNFFLKIVGKCCL